MVVGQGSKRWWVAPQGEAIVNSFIKQNTEDVFS